MCACVREGDRKREGERGRLSVCARLYVYMYMCVCACVRAFVCVVRAHACARTCESVCVHVSVLACVCSRVRVCLYVCIRTFMCAYTRTKCIYSHQSLTDVCSVPKTPGVAAEEGKDGGGGRTTPKQER